MPSGNNPMNPAETWTAINANAATASGRNPAGMSYIVKTTASPIPIARAAAPMSRYKPAQLPTVFRTWFGSPAAMSCAMYLTHAMGTPSARRLMYPVIDVMSVHVP
jgi:hypothetical protein